MHEPSALHVSAPLHALPSVHDAPVFGVITQPVAGTQVSEVHALRSSMLGGAPATQPVAGAHVSKPLQALPSPQPGGVPAVTTPPWQVSIPLQRSPSFAS